MYLLCCGASFAVIRVDILHGDQGDAVFLSIGCRAARGTKGTWAVKWRSRRAMGWQGTVGSSVGTLIFVSINLYLVMDPNEMGVCLEA